MATLTLVRFRFLPLGYEAPSRVTVSALATVDELVEQWQSGAHSLPEWPWSERESKETDRVRWLQERTRDTFFLSLEEGLLQCAYEESAGSVVALYVFDERYVRAHPEAFDDEHLQLAHGTIAAKLFDDAVRLLDEEATAAALRWRSVRARGTQLKRDGGKHRTGV